MPLELAADHGERQPHGGCASGSTPGGRRGGGITGVKVYALCPQERDLQIVEAAPMSTSARDERAGVRQGDTWEPHPVRLLSEADGVSLGSTDWPFLSLALFVVKDAALVRLRDRLAPWCEFLPLACPQEPLTVINVLNIVDALDEDATRARRLQDSRILLVDQYQFHADRLPEDGLFKIPQLVARATFAIGPAADLLQQEDHGPRLRLEWER